MLKKILSGVIPVAIVLVGLGVFSLLRSMGAPPERVERDYAGPLVEGVAAPPQSVQVTIEGWGTVEPVAQIGLVPQVAGLVVWTSPEMEGGGAFRRGDLLARIEPEDYELAVARAEADVARAEYQLDVARGEAEVARREWELLQAEGGDSSEPDPLVLREPQMRAARADLKSWRARLQEARLRLERTRLLAPFDGRVRATTLEAGQYVTVGQPVAQLYSIERAQIVVPVPDGEMAWLDLESRPEAAISATYAGREHRWRGRVVRTTGEIDPRSRMVHLVVEVDEPYRQRAEAGVPLTVGMFVDVEVAGRELQGVRSIPRLALRPGNAIWTAGSDGVLKVRQVQVLRAGRETVLIRAALEPDERVIVSQIRGVTEGMRVRLGKPEAKTP